MAATTTARPTTSSRSTWRWVTFLLVALMIAGLFYWARTTQIADDSFRMFFMEVAVFLSLVLFSVWFVFFGFSRWWVRMGLVILGFVALIGGLFVGFTYFIEFRGVTGDWVPEIAWKSTPKKDYSLPSEPPVETPTVAPAPAGEVPDFARFLGSDGSNHVEGVGLDPDWEKHPPKELWRKKVGAGWSAFAVVKERAVTQEQRGDFELVTCYNLRDGALLWSHKDKARFSEFQGGDGPRATPTIVGDQVFTMGATGILNCLRLDKGEVVWTKNVLEDNAQGNYVPMWAKSDSPLVYDATSPDGVQRQLVVVTLGADDRNPTPLALLAAYDGKTGERVWVGGSGEKGSAYATPILTTRAGTRQVVSVNGMSVTGHDPATGKVLWDYSWPSTFGAKCSQPVPVGDDKLFLSMGYGAGAQLIQVAKAGDAFTATQLWANKNMRTTFSNVVVYEGNVYGLDDGVLQCIDLATGAKKWREGRYRYGQVLGVDDLLLVQAEDGKVFLVAADPEKHRELGELDALHSKTWNNPVLVGKYLLVRDAEEAVCYELPLKGGK